MILLIDIDSKIPNLALKKIESYYLKKKEKVVWNNVSSRTIADKIYVSCIFTKNKELAEQWKEVAEIGGSGYNLTKELPLEIESVNPHINLGFTTRGCIRKCPFCIVWKKEPELKIVGDLLDLWDGKPYFIDKKNKKHRTIITILDNNILALPEHFKMICKQSKENKLCLDFNQGLDHRLITPEIVKELKNTSHIEYRFSFDHPSYENTVEKAIDLLQKGNIKRCQWYVLVGFNTSPKEDLFRCNYLKNRGQNVYIQRYESCYDKPFYIALARWGNQRHLFQGMTWEQFLNHPDNKNYKRKIKEKL